MEENSLNTLFESYRPRLRDSQHFIENLERNINVLEPIRIEMKKKRRNNFRRGVYAAVAGFVTGFIMSLLMPAFIDTLNRILREVTLTFPTINGVTVGCFLTAIAVFLAAATTFNALKPKHS